MSQRSQLSKVDLPFLQSELHKSEIGLWTPCWLYSFLLSILACSFAPRAELKADEPFVPLNTQAKGEHPLPATEALKRLSVPKGFQVTLAAAEPAVRQPIAIAFDDRGRLWVAESYSYDGSTFTDEKHDRILIFEDTNGDGVLDKRKVFHDKLTHLTGLTIGFGGVWYTAPPYLAFIPDRDHSDQPDSPDHVIHLDGWSLKAEHNSVNGLTWGPDGWLYGRHGIKQPSLVGRPGTPKSKRIELSCSIWRYHPTRHIFEVVADGTINPWGLDFNSHGHAFFTTNVIDHLWHLVPGARYQRWKDRAIHPNPYVYETMTSANDHLHWPSSWQGRDTKKLADFGGGHSHCDAMIYLGGSWPKQYHGTLFTSNIHGRRINRDKFITSPNQPFVATHAEDFLRADDPWFRAVSLEYGPDGDVYMTDWSDNGECHDRDGVHRTSGRIYKISYGKPSRVQVDLQSASNEQLVEFQWHTNEWYVRHARRVLQERASRGESMTSIVPVLKNAFTIKSVAEHKLRAMWLLYCIGGASESWLRDQLTHHEPNVRSWAVQLLSNGKTDPNTISRFDQLAKVETSWIVRMHLAASLQRLPFKRRISLARSLSQAEKLRDANLERLIWYGIEPAIAANPDAALDNLDTLPAKLRTWIARRVTEVRPRLPKKLLAYLTQTTEPNVTRSVIDGIRMGIRQHSSRESSWSDADLALITARFNDADGPIQRAAVDLGAQVGSASTISRLRALTKNSKIDLATRQVVLEGLVRRRPKWILDELKQHMASNPLRHTALRLSVGISDNSFLRSLINDFKSFQPKEKTAAINVLCARKEGANLLLEAIEQKLIPVDSVTADNARQITNLRDKSLSKRLEQFWGAVQSTSKERQTKIRAWKKRLDPTRIAKADFAAGRKLFAKHCANCHKLYQNGKAIGPDLTGADRRNLGYLLSNVIDPSAAIPADFRLTTIETKRGRVISGSIMRETPQVLTIQTTTEVIELGVDQIERRKLTRQSLMPDGLLDRLTDDEVRDLFAYLMSARD